jgi:DNA-binding transcriptional LysR family regulator
MSVDTSLLRHFVAVAQTGSFTRASELVHASQPVVSRSIQRLEDRVGTQLMERSTRSVVLTVAGKAFFEDALQVLNRLAVGIDNARRIGRGQLAELRIGICPTVESPEIVQGILRFRHIWPDTELKIRGMISNELSVALAGSALDVGIMQGGGLPAEILQWQILSRHQQVVAVPAEWGCRKDKPIKLADLKDRPWLVPRREIAREPHDNLIEMCHRAGFEPTIAGTVDEPVTARIMIACGIGCTFFHDSVWQYPYEGIDILQFEDRQIFPQAERAVVWPIGSNAPQVLDLVDCLSQAFQSSVASDRALDPLPAKR